MTKREECRPIAVNSAAIAAAVGFLAAVYTPLELYFYNQNEFLFDFGTLFPTLCGLFAAVFIADFLLLLILAKINKTVFHIAVLAETVAFLASYIQGNFLAADLPALDGSAVDWSAYGKDNLITLGVWAAIIAVVVFLAVRFGLKKVGNAAKWPALGVTLMLLITLVTVAVQTDGTSSKTSATVTDKNLFTMSEDKNFVILLLDAVDSTTFSEVLEQDGELRECLSDFTYYPNTMGTYSFTDRAIPFILSGEWFENTEVYEDWAQRAYEDGALPKKMQQAGYTLGMYDDGVLKRSDKIFMYENIVSNGDIGFPYKLAILELKLSLFKLVPYQFKDKFMFDMYYFLAVQPEYDGYSPYFWHANSFYQALKDTAIKIQEQPSFKFIHLDGAHVPFEYDEQLNTVENGSYEGEVKACATLIKTYLAKLQEARVYDNSVIIIMADHGYTTEYRQTPLLMIKGFEESKDELTISNAPISFDDLQEAYENLLKGNGGADVFSAKEGDERSRRYLYFIFNAESYMTEYEQTGDAWNNDTMQATGREFNREK